jgi:hypothetical protein
LTLVIENPTPQAKYDAIQTWSEPERAKLRDLLQSEPEMREQDDEAWYAASTNAAARFFAEEED